MPQTKECEMDRPATIFNPETDGYCSECGELHYLEDLTVDPMVGSLCPDCLIYGKAIPCSWCEERYPYEALTNVPHEGLLCKYCNEEVESE